MDIKIRKLLKSDQKKISDLLLRLVDKIDDKSITDIISNSAGSGEGSELSEEQRRTNIIRVFFELFKKLFVHFTDDVNVFLADLIGVTPEEYQQLPIDIDVRIFEQLKEAPEIENFFTGSLRLFSATQWFKNLYQTLKSKYDSATGSQAMS